MRRQHIGVVAAMAGGAFAAMAGAQPAWPGMLLIGAAICLNLLAFHLVDDCGEPGREE